MKGILISLKDQSKYILQKKKETNKTILLPLLFEFLIDSAWLLKILREEKEHKSLKIINGKILLLLFIQEAAIVVSLAAR